LGLELLENKEICELSEKSKYVVKNISYNNLVVLNWMNMIVVKLGLHKERHKKYQECDI
jgi:hypothetical protein